MTQGAIPDFTPTQWNETEIVERLRAKGIEVPDACLPGVKANLALLEDRWQVVSAVLAKGMA